MGVVIKLVFRLQFTGQGSWKAGYADLSQWLGLPASRLAG